MECYLNETKISQRSSQRIWICKPLKETLRRLGNCFKILEGRIRLSIVAQFWGHFQRFGQVLNSTSGGHLHWQPTLGALSCSGRGPSLGPRLPGWLGSRRRKIVDCQFESFLFTTGCITLPKQMNFPKRSGGGGGGHFQSRNIADFFHYKQ